MSAVGKIVGGVLGGVGGALAGGLFKEPKLTQAPDQIRQPVRSAAVEAGRADDALRKRRGFAANILNGRTGAEAQAPSLAQKVLFGG